MDSPPFLTRFVVLRHEDRAGVHFDLMIQNGDSLATWKSAAPPETANEGGLPLQRIGDHRRIYLEYEGPISGDRGTVSRHDGGTCSVQCWEPRRIDVEFGGARLGGRFRLLPVDAAAQSWSLCRLRG